jgi:hypothetical protein
MEVVKADHLYHKSTQNRKGAKRWLLTPQVAEARTLKAKRSEEAPFTDVTLDTEAATNRGQDQAEDLNGEVVHSVNGAELSNARALHKEVARESRLGSGTEILLRHGIVSGSRGGSLARVRSTALPQSPTREQHLPLYSASYV